MATYQVRQVVTRRSMLRSAGVTVGLFALAPLIQACGQAATPTAAPGGATKAPAGEPSKAPDAAKPAATEGKVSIRFVAMDYDERTAQDQEDLMEKFNQSQNKVEAKVEVVKWSEGMTVLLAQIGANQPPDIANHSGAGMGEFNAAGELEPLDSYLGADFLKDFVKPTLDAMTVSGKLMGMPYFLDPRGLFYRTDLFEQAGLKSPETWDDVRAAAKQLHKAPDMYGIGKGYGDYWWYAWLGAHGTGVDLTPWDPNTKKSLVGNEQGVAAVQHLVDLARTDKVTNPNPENAERDADLQPLFLAGKLAMLETGSWFPTIIQQSAPDLKFDVARIPVAKSGMQHANAFWPDVVMMFKQSQHKDEATELLKFMFTKENRLLWAKQRGVVPERTDVGTDPQYAVSKFEKFFFEEVETAYNVFITPFPGNYSKNSRSIRDGMTKALLGEMPAKEAMEEAAANIDKDNGVA